MIGLVVVEALHRALVEELEREWVARSLLIRDMLLDRIRRPP